MRRLLNLAQQLQQGRSARARRHDTQRPVGE
jgi:hypothetical protein